MAFEASGPSDPTWVTKTYEEIEAIAESDGSVLIVPVGSVEQHGEHLPVGTDTILVDAFASLAAERVADEVPVLATPPVWHGYSPHHLPFGGTVTTELDSLVETLEEIVDSATAGGFDAVLLLNGHGGNAPAISSATSTIGVSHPELEVLGLTYFALAEPYADEIRDSDPGGWSHGGEFETSLMLHLRPDLVREDALDAPLLDEPYDLGVADMMAVGPLSVYRSFDEYTETGAIGAPELASAEKGDALYEAVGDELETLLTAVHDRHAG